MEELPEDLISLQISTPIPAACAFSWASFASAMNPTP
jgi:hypothetical protein